MIENPREFTGSTHFLQGGTDLPPTPAELFAGIDLDEASIARLYDFYLGGCHNFGVDRQLADQILVRFPWTVAAARSNRALLERMVRYLCGRGVRQFLDLGSGIPTANNVHEVAQSLTVGSEPARVVYVDIDPVAVEMSRRVLTGDPNTTAVHADMADAEQVLAEATGLLDLRAPVALLAISVLMYVPDDRIGAMMASYQSALAPGSHLGITHASFDHVPPDDLADMLAMRQVANERTGLQLTMRDRSRVYELFGDWRMVPPGLTFAADWHATVATRTVVPEGTHPLWRTIGYAGMARKLVSAGG